MAPWCKQRATISCPGCRATLYCSNTCGHLDRHEHSCICPIILSISRHRKWDHLRSEGWEPTHILALTNRFANPPTTSTEKFDILYGDNPFICQLAEEAIIYTRLTLERIHQIAVDATPETLLQLSRQLLTLKMKHMAKESVSSSKHSRHHRQTTKKTKLSRAHTYRRRPCPSMAPDVEATKENAPAPEQDQRPAVRDAPTPLSRSIDLIPSPSTLPSANYVESSIETLGAREEPPSEERRGLSSVQQPVPRGACQRCALATTQFPHPDEEKCDS
jgi:hypothetical protein